MVHPHHPAHQVGARDDLSSLSDDQPARRGRVRGMRLAAGRDADAAGLHAAAGVRPALRSAVRGDDGAAARGIHAGGVAGWATATLRWSENGDTPRDGRDDDSSDGDHSFGLGAFAMDRAAGDGSVCGYLCRSMRAGRDGYNPVPSRRLEVEEDLIPCPFQLGFNELPQPARPSMPCDPRCG